MSDSEQTILDELISRWVSLGVEFATGAPDVSRLYFYAASEEGSSYVEVLFDQAGVIDYPGRLRGVANGLDRVGKLHALQFEDLFTAEDRFIAIGVPVPT